ncbi:hypothetical protein ACFL6D_05600, partial [Spirochaetota bacterium]
MQDYLLKILSFIKKHLVVFSGICALFIIVFLSAFILYFNRKSNLLTRLIIPTYLGNDTRRYYGSTTPTGLSVFRKINLGKGKTKIGNKYEHWSGGGWTGQPTIVGDRGKVYLIIGAYDHLLHKIDLDSYEEVWRYRFNDVIKGTATLFIDNRADESNRIVILQGSRKGTLQEGPTKSAYSFKAISFRTGELLFELDIEKTESMSRDNDSSPLYLGERRIFNAAENGIGYFLTYAKSGENNGRAHYSMHILSKLLLYNESDIKKHGRDLIVEASPARIASKIYQSCGSGHVYGIDTDTM